MGNKQKNKEFKRTEIDQVFEDCDQITSRDGWDDLNYWCKVAIELETNYSIDHGARRFAIDALRMVCIRECLNLCTDIDE